MGRLRVELDSPEKTVALGKYLSQILPSGSVVALLGELGAGKTTFVQGYAEGLNIKDLIQSPTFTYLHIYEGDMPIYHFDLYRLKNASDFLSLGFDEYLEKEGVSIIEWPQRIELLLPQKTTFISLDHRSKGRYADITSPFLMKEKDATPRSSWPL